MHRGQQQKHVVDGMITFLENWSMMRRSLKNSHFLLFLRFELDDDEDLAPGEEVLALL